MKVTSRSGDALDLIVWRHYGYVEGAIEAVYRVNPGLCDRPLILPAGVEILLPDDPPKPAIKISLPWE